MIIINMKLKIQVFLEECPNESFMEVSADKCWELVLQRLNQEILKNSELASGDVRLPPGVNGLEMFGLSSPAIIQVHLCSLL